MEYYWSMFNGSNESTSSNCVRGHNCNYASNHAWDSSFDLAGCATCSRADYLSYPLPNSFNFPPPAAAAAAAAANDSAFHALMLYEHEKGSSRHSNCSSAATAVSFPCVGKERSYYSADPHLTCLKLGKRHYFEDVNPPVEGEKHAAAARACSMIKKGKPYLNATARGAADCAAPAVPRCQVEGCEAVLVSAKDYHRKHKVCAIHAKAPKVVVHGNEQRFCQQCSRFHAVAEFDDSKRSCRKRLAGHNERRRKGSREQNALARKHSQDIKMMAAGRRYPHYLNNMYSERALSLLSSAHYAPFNVPTSPDLPARCSAALHELIAENRASILACRQLINANQMEEGGGHVTLNLMQAPDSTFGLAALHDHRSSKEGGARECSELWKVPLGY